MSVYRRRRGLTTENRRPSLPPKYSKEFLKIHLDKARENFWQSARKHGITDFSEASLRRLDELIWGDMLKGFEEEGCPDPDLEKVWFATSAPGSYLGDVLVHNLNGTWRYPNLLVCSVGLMFQRPDWIYRHWYVIVGKRRVKVFVVAKRRWTGGREGASLMKAYEEIAGRR